MISAKEEFHLPEETKKSDLPDDLENFGPGLFPLLHPLLHGGHDGVGLVVGAVLVALFGGTYNI